MNNPKERSHLSTSNHPKKRREKDMNSWKESSHLSTNNNPTKKRQE
jgi:hypothetical protein